MKLEDVKVGQAVECLHYGEWAQATVTRIKKAGIVWIVRNGRERWVFPESLRLPMEEEPT